METASPTSQLIFATVQGPRSVAAADLDGDGNTDLTVTGNGVCVLFGKGNGTFDPHLDYFSALDVGPVIAADFDGDSRPDLAAVNQFAASISIFANRAAVALRPDQLSFPAELVASSSPPQTTTVYNPGIFPLQIQGVTSTGDFSQTNTCGTSLALSGNCTVSVTFTPTSAGQRSGTATINDNAAGGKQSVSLIGAATDFSLAAASGANCPSGGNCSTTATIHSGQTATYKLQVSPLGGFAGIVSLSCGGGPSSTTCTVSPSVLQPTGSSSYAFTVTVTDAASMTALGETDTPVVPNNTLRSSVPLLFGMGLAVLFACAGMVAGQEKRLPAAALVLMMVVSLVCLGGCGGGGTTVIPPTNATITVTGTSGGLSRSLPLSLVIDQTTR